MKIGRRPEKLPVTIAFLAMALAACGGDDSVAPVVQPPALGPTIFIDPDILTADDPTTLETVEPAGTGERTMFDRRVDDDVVVEAHLFDVTFDDGLSAEVQVNPEFDAAEALAAAEKYAEIIGRLPTALRDDVATVWIHAGTELFGGGNDNILIHTGQADDYEADGFLEEALLHQAAHTSLDAAHATAPAWLAAQELDNRFISQPAEDDPIGEDLAETMVPYIALRYQSDGITDFLAATIAQAIPARIEYLDAQGFDMYPLN